MQRTEKFPRTIAAPGFLFCILLAWAGLIPNPALAEGSAEHERRLDLSVTSAVLATKGNAVVTAADLGAYLSRMPEDERSGFLYSRSRLGDAIDNLMMPRLAASAAEEDGFLDADNEVLYAQLQQAALVLISREFFKHHLEQRQLDDYSQVARELYLNEPSKFTSPDTYDFSHILISVGQRRGELDAMERVMAVYEALESGASFEDTASEYSDDPGLEANGGTYTGAQLVELDEAVSQSLQRMAPGQISEPVRSQYGWHVIRLDAEHSGGQLEFEEAESEAIDLARQRHRERIQNQLVNRLKSSDLEFNTANLRGFLERYDIIWEGAE